MFKRTFLLTLIILGTLAACGPMPTQPAPVDFSQLVGNKASYMECPSGFYCWTFINGVVVYADRDKGFYVATANPTPKASGDLADNQYILVKSYMPDNLTVGSVVTVSEANVDERTGQDKNGNDVTVQYLSGTTTVTGKVNAADPNFEDLVKIVDTQITQQNNTMIFFFIYFFYLNPYSPFSPFHNSSEP